MTALLTPRPAATDSPITNAPRRRRRLRLRLLAVAAVPVALVMAGVLVLVTLFASGFGGLSGNGFGFLASDPNSNPPIVLNAPRLAGRDQNPWHTPAKTIAAGLQS